MNGSDDASLLNPLIENKKKNTFRTIHLYFETSPFFIVTTVKCKNIFW